MSKFYHFGFVYDDGVTEICAFDEFLIDLMAKYNVVQSMLKMIDRILICSGRNYSEKVFRIDLSRTQKAQFLPDSDDIIDVNSRSLLKSLIIFSFKEVIRDSELTDDDKIDYISDISSMVHHIEDSHCTMVTLKVDEFKQAFSNVTGESVNDDKNE